MTLIELQRNRTVDVIWIRRLQRASPVPPPPRARSPLAGRGSKPSGSKNHARPLSLPRAFRELGLRSPPAGRTRPAPPARPAGSGRRHRDAGSACASPPANVPCAVAAPCGLRRASPPANAPCTAAPPCGLRPPPPARAQGGAGAGHCRRDVRRLRARPPPPSRQPSFLGFSDVFLGIFHSSRWRPNPARFV